MAWTLFQHQLPTKEELKRILGRARFYCDHNVEPAIVEVLRHLNYDVESARDIAAEQQPDEFHYRRAFKSKRILITLDKDFLDNVRFPLSQTRGVIILNIDTADTGKIARALEVVDVILGGIAPTLKESKVVVNSDYTVTFLRRIQDARGFSEDRTRYRFDDNGRDIWVWED